MLIILIIAFSVMTQGFSFAISLLTEEESYTFHKHVVGLCIVAIQNSRDGNSPKREAQLPHSLHLLKEMQDLVFLAVFDSSLLKP